MAAGRKSRELGEGAGGLVRQKNKTVLDRRRLGMEAHDLVGRQTAGIDPLLPFVLGLASGGEASFDSSLSRRRDGSSVTSVYELKELLFSTSKICCPPLEKKLGRGNHHEP